MRAARNLLLAGLLSGVGPALPAAALAQATAPGAEPGVTTEDCRVTPGDGSEAAPSQDGDLTAKLDACNGVLQPPATGDAEIREPAPEAGETPVIPPGAVPDQAPDGTPLAPAPG